MKLVTEFNGVNVYQDGSIWFFDYQSKHYSKEQDDYSDKDMIELSQHSIRAAQGHKLYNAIPMA